MSGSLRGTLVQNTLKSVGGVGRFPVSTVPSILMPSLAKTCAATLVRRLFTDLYALTAMSANPDTL
jgi:hypothetical protein